MSIRLKILFTNINQLWQIFPLHIFAFTMEIKPNVFKLIIFEFLKQPCKLISYFQLTSFSVNQINQILFWVCCFCLFEMLFCCHYWFLEVSFYFHRWRPFQVRFHTPNQGNWASYLHKTSCFNWRRRLPFTKDMFSFYKISSITITIKPPTYKSSSRPSTIFSRNQIKLSR